MAETLHSQCRGPEFDPRASTDLVQPNIYIYIYIFFFFFFFKDLPLEIDPLTLRIHSSILETHDVIHMHSSDCVKPAMGRQ